MPIRTWCNWYYVIWFQIRLSSRRKTGKLQFALTNRIHSSVLPLRTQESALQKIRSRRSMTNYTIRQKEHPVKRGLVLDLCFAKNLSIKAVDSYIYQVFPVKEAYSPLPYQRSRQRAINASYHTPNSVFVTFPGGFVTSLHFFSFLVLSLL